ncbi:DUF4124 domain-containing protein [Variovorax sp. YR566]|uniref:DUF4124 domain-containing protein n=1 Tax=Variovorax sp. YR566 TaxID=3450237 RepID=UPI003F808C72
MAAALSGRPETGLGSQRYWAPCLALALLAVFLFYVALTDLLRERAARAPVQAVVVPAVVRQPPATARSGDALPASSAALPVRASALPASPSTPSDVLPVAAAPARSTVTKCVTPSGTAEYSDGPCTEGSQVSTLHLQ